MKFLTAIAIAVMYSSSAFSAAPAAKFFVAPPGQVIANKVVWLRSRTGYLFQVTMPGLTTALYPYLDCHRTHLTIQDTDLMAEYAKVRTSVDSFVSSHKSPVSAPVATTAPVIIYANLCNATISQKAGSNIQNISLTDADFTSASLESVTFWDIPIYDAGFTEANLERSSFLNVDGDQRGHGSKGHVIGTEFVNFSGADMRDAHIQWSNLKGADFREANLDGATLMESDLSEGDFRSSTLNGALITGSNLKDALFAGADLSNVVYEPAPGDLPDLASFSEARHLDEITYRETPARLVELREGLHQAGLGSAERAINFDINRVRSHRLRTNGTLLEKTQGYLEYIFLELPTSWGYHPLLALGWILLGILVCWPFYSYKIMTTDLISESGFVRIDINGVQERRQRLLGQTLVRRIWWGLYISVLSAFNIGWQGLNLKSWITRIQTKTFHIEATGWVRTLSGVQALFSVYMLVTFLFTYFGRPFAE
ncbi:MAG TPA: pentapeptide repeat-containing protein [Gammaproteobacteria bacterium]|jgi:hypothetical protein